MKNNCKQETNMAALFCVPHQLCYLVWCSSLLLILAHCWTVARAAPVLDHNAALSLNLNAADSSEGLVTWQIAAVALVCVVCPVTVVFMCLCCKHSSSFKHSLSSSSIQQGSEVCSISSHVSRGQQEVALQGLQSAVPSEPVEFEPLPDIGSMLRLSQPKASFPQTFADDSGAVAANWFDSPHQNFPRNQLQYIRQIGTGQFGPVLEGRAVGVFTDHSSSPDCSPRDPQPTVTTVIVKSLRENALADEQTAFLQELKPYRVLQHPNLLKVLGVCLEAPPFLVLLQHCSKGTLKSWLRQEGGALTNHQLLTAILDVAAGLSHMHSNGLLHKDLAARTCLVSQENKVKIGDYGCSLDHYKHEYYLAGDIALPIRWCPPESLTCTATTIHTSQVTAPSNVWTFGVLCHEVLTLAAHLPYHPLTDEQVLQRVIIDQRTVPHLPSDTHPSLLKIIEKCWVFESSRPNLSMLHQELCGFHVEAYGTQHPSHGQSESSSLQVSPLNLPSLSSDLDSRWEQMKETDVFGQHNCLSSGALPAKHLRFESNFVTSNSDDLDERVAATFGSSAPSWLGLEPGQPMDSLTMEISSAIQRLDDALADNVQPAEEQLYLSQIQEDSNDVLPSFLIGKDSLVTTKAQRHSVPSGSLSASASNLTSLGVSREALADSGKGGLSGSADLVSTLGQEDDGLSLRLEQDEFTELVKEKSKSVQDLMKMTVVDGINLDESGDSYEVSLDDSSLDDRKGKEEKSCAKMLRHSYDDLLSDSKNKALVERISRKTESCSSELAEGSGGSSTLSSTPTNSSVNVGHFLVAANSSELLLLSEEFSDTSRPESRATFDAPQFLDNKNFDNRNHVYQLNGAAGLFDVKDETFESPVQVSQLSTPDVTAEAVYTSNGQGLDMLPDIVVHDNNCKSFRKEQIEEQEEGFLVLKKQAEDIIESVISHKKDEISDFCSKETPVGNQCEEFQITTNEVISLEETEDIMAGLNACTSDTSGIVTGPTTICSSLATNFSGQSSCDLISAESAFVEDEIESCVEIVDEPVVVNVVTEQNIALVQEKKAFQEHFEDFDDGKTLEHDDGLSDKEPEIGNYSSDSTSNENMAKATSTPNRQEAVEQMEFSSSLAEVSLPENEQNKSSLEYSYNNYKSPINPLDWTVDSLPPNSILSSSKQKTTPDVSTLSECQLPPKESATFNILDDEKEQNGNSETSLKPSTLENHDLKLSNFVMKPQTSDIHSEVTCNIATAPVDVDGSVVTPSGDFWQQQMSAWQVAAQETRELLMAASATSPAPGELKNHWQERIKEDVCSLASSSAYSPCLTAGSSVEGSPSASKYSKPLTHFLATRIDSDGESIEASPLAKGRDFNGLSSDEESSSPQRRSSSFLSSPYDSPSSKLSSYVSYDALGHEHHNEEEMLGYCPEDLNALRAELSLKLPVSPREEETEEEMEAADEAGGREHVLINYRGPTTLSPIKEEEPGLLDEGKDNTSASTYNSSIEFVDSYDDSPATFIIDSVEVKEDLHLPRQCLPSNRDKCEEMHKEEDGSCTTGVDAVTQFVDDEKHITDSPILLTPVSQLPISSSSVITTASNEEIPVDPRTSLILEDLEASDNEEPTVLVFTARKESSYCPTLDSNDLLVVDVDTHAASILETPRSQSHLAFIHSPHSSPDLHRPKLDQKSMDENEALEEQIAADYQDEVDNDSLPYEINSSKDRLLFQKLQEDLQEAKRLRKSHRRYTKDVREPGDAQSLDYMLLSDPLCDIDFDSAWQQRSLNIDGKIGSLSCVKDFNGAYLERSSSGESTEVNYEEGCGLTTNSPNSTSTTSQSSTGVNFRIGPEDSRVENGQVSRYQPYFTSSFNSLSQLDSSVMFSDDHVSLPYTVNLQDLQTETLKASKSLVSVQETSQEASPFRNFISLDNISGGIGGELKPVVAASLGGEDASLIRSKEIDLKDRVMRELGQQIETIKSIKREKWNSKDLDNLESSEEDLALLSVGLLNHGLSESKNSSRSQCNSVPDHENSDVNAQSLSNGPHEKHIRDVTVDYESDDYSPETDYVESRKVGQEFFVSDNGDVVDLLPRPKNPEPAELSDYAYTPSPAISIDCSVAAMQNREEDYEEGGVQSPLPQEGVMIVTKFRNCVEEQSEEPSSFRNFSAPSLEKEASDEEVVEEEEAAVEVPKCEPSPVVTPGGLASVRYRMCQEYDDRNEVIYTPDWEEDDKECDSDDGEDGEEQSEGSEDDGDSSSSGEFLWQAGDAPAQARPVQAICEEEEEADDESCGDSESGEEEFTPSFWDASRTPTRSLLKQLSAVEDSSPSKLNKSVRWKREKHHRVYEYPPEPVQPLRGVWGPSVQYPPPPAPHWSTSHSYLHQHYPPHDGFLFDDGEFFNTDLYNFSQSTFCPSDFYSNSPAKDCTGAPSPDCAPPAPGNEEDTPKGLGETAFTSVGELKHVKDQLTLDLPSLAVSAEASAPSPAVLASES